MRVEQVAVLVLEVERGTHIPIAALLAIPRSQCGPRVAAFPVPGAFQIRRSELIGQAGLFPTSRTGSTVTIFHHLVQKPVETPALIPP
jgi:hypothetical protein